MLMVSVIFVGGEINTMNMNCKRWSDEDVAYLEEAWGVRPIPKIAERLGRTENAIRTKALRLNLGSFSNNGELVSLYQIICAFGSKNNYYYYCKRFLDNDLQVVRKRVSKQIVYKVNIDYFWEWAESHQDILNFTRLEKGMLGKEPLWVDSKRKSDLNNPLKINFNRRWTREDDNKLISMCKTYKYTLGEVATDLRRTEHAVQKRLRTLNVPYRLSKIRKNLRNNDE